MPYAIRLATLDDIPELCRQRRRMFEDMGYADPDVLGAMAERFAQWVTCRLKNQTYFAWLAVDPQQTVVAGAGLWLIDWPSHVLDAGRHRGYILNVYTEPAYRKQGLARQLTEQCVNYCREQQFVVVSLHASEHGRALYESLGFASSNEMRLILGK